MQMRFINSLSEQNKIDIERVVKETKSSVKTAKVLGLNKNTVTSYIKRNGLAIHLSKQKNIEPDFLPEERQLAYFAGLIATDGCLHPNKLISINLKYTDETTVRWLGSIISTNLSPRYGTNTNTKKTVGFENSSPQWRLRYKAPKMYDYLMAMGITPAKTYTLNPKLDDKSDEFLWYFLRGVIDGDGCVYISKNKSIHLINITSASRAFVDKLQSIFGGNISTRAPGIGKVPLYVLEFISHKAKTLASHLPIDDFTMSRKTEKILQVRDREVKKNFGSILVGSMWENATKYPQKKSLKQLYLEIPNPKLAFPSVQARVTAGKSWEEALSAAKP